MKLIYIKGLALAVLVITGCMKDRTGYDSNILSEIGIQLNHVPDTIQIDRNAQLVLDPVVNSNSNEPLQYEWQVNYQTVSSNKKIDYTCTTLGLFPVRLKVWNSDGAVFKNFTLSVNSQYEEGIILLSEKPDGEGEISFMRSYTPAELQAGKVEAFETDCFVKNNPGEKMGKTASDIVKRKLQLMVSLRDERTIKLLNAKTLELESVIAVNDLPNFKPVKINEPDNGFRTIKVLSADGKVYDFATLEQQVLNSSMMPANTQFAGITALRPGSNFNSNYFWDPAGSRLWNLWYLTTSTKDTLQQQELRTFFQADGLVYILTNHKQDVTQLSKSVFGEYLQEYMKQPLDCKEIVPFTSTGIVPTSISPTALASRYKKLFYAVGNQVYQWFYATTNFPAQPIITVDIPGTVSCMEVSPDGEHLYVAINNTAAAGLTGSVQVFDVNTGAKEKSFTGVGYKPVKIMYKKKI